MAKIYISTVVKAPSDKVWAKIRDFNGLPDWTSFVVESRIEQGLPSDKIGCVRAFKLGDGGGIRERLLALSDFDYSFTYAILESPMEVENYTATMKLTPITDAGHTFAEWSAEFDCPPSREDELVNHIGTNVFQSALDTLKSQFGG